jgi:hypothetical protein
MDGRCRQDYRMAAVSEERRRPDAAWQDRRLQSRSPQGIPRQVGDARVQTREHTPSLCLTSRMSSTDRVLVLPRPNGSLISSSPPTLLKGFETSSKLAPNLTSWSSTRPARELPKTWANPLSLPSSSSTFNPTVERPLSQRLARKPPSSPRELPSLMRTPCRGYRWRG